MANGDALIETKSPGYVLRVLPETIDTVRFQRLVEGGGVDNRRSALALWNERPLVEFAYEEWAQSHIRRIENLHAKAVEMLASAELEDGRAVEVPGLVQGLIEREPLREEPRRLLMLALYRSGR